MRFPMHTDITLTVEVRRGLLPSPLSLTETESLCLYELPAKSGFTGIRYYFAAFLQVLVVWRIG